MARYTPLFYRGAPASIPQVVAHIQRTLTEEDPDYTPLRQRMPPASIPEIVAHIQEYLSENVFVEVEDLGEDIAQYIEDHPEIVGVLTVNGSSGNVTLDASDIPIETGEDPTVAGAISYLSSQLALLVADAVLSVNGLTPDDSHNVTLTGANITQDGNTTKKLSETFGPASASEAGSKGLVPAPQIGDQDKVLSGSGAWVNQSTGAVQTVCNVGPNAQGNIPLMGSNIPLQSMSLQTVAQAIAAVDGKTGSAIPTSTTDNTPISTSLSNLNDQIAHMYSLLMDGTAATYKKLMKEFFDAHNANAMTPADLTELVSIWYEVTRDNWNGYTRFYKPSVSTVSTGTKGGDNAGMVCEPSTDAVAGRDDYAGLPLFAPTDVNYTIDADTLEPVITGIKGITSGFEKDNPDKLVGVIQMSGYLYSDTDTDTFDVGYSAQPLTGHGSCQPVPEAVKVDGTVRQFVIHTKYMGKVVNNKMRAYSGVIPTAWQSHNTLQPNCKANGTQYGGGSVLLQSWLILMTRIKYGSLTQDGSVQGCLNYNYQYYASVAETGVKRLLITPAQAATLIVGSGVLVGTVGANANVDRNTASVYSISGQKGAIVTAIESVEIEGTTYGAVYVDTDDVFNTVGNGTKTTGNTMISTFHWPTGTNDNILGNDGSKASPGTGVYPAKLQGIEYSVGAWEVFGDVIIRMLPADNDHEFGMIKFALVDRAANQTTSVTANYRDSGVELTKPSSAAGWSYIKHQSAPTSVFLADDCSSGGSSSVLTRDAFYFSAVVTSEALRGFPAFGSLAHGVAYGGLSSVTSLYALSYDYWSFCGRPSACGNRGGLGGVPPQ